MIRQSRYTSLLILGVAGALGYAAAGGLTPSAQPDDKKTATA